MSPMATELESAQDLPTKSEYGQIDVLAINTLRALSIDASFKANSGHPGAPMGLAPLAHVLFGKMRFNPGTNKSWVNRDRFVLSNGHACSLLYSLLHLYGCNISLDDLKAFRHLGSKTCGHPEAHITPGIEVTTGPLGQGFANAVGLAIAQSHMAATYNKPDFDLFTNHTFVVFGDGCAMEGVASEAASLAGHLRLGQLIAIYDDNHVSIDGNTNSTFTEDVLRRFEAYGWHTQHVEDGNTDLDAISRAIDAAMAVKDKPSVVKVTTTIGFGSLLQGTGGVHGSPLKADDIKQFKKKVGISPEPFHVPAEVRTLYHKHTARGAVAEARWREMFTAYATRNPKLHAELARRLSGELPEGWQKVIPTYTATDPSIASRKLSETVISALQSALPELISGSADLTPSNLTRWKNATDFQAPETGLGNRAGRYLRWGVREHAMGAAMNGIAAYGANLIPCAGTFLNFVSYAAGAVRLSALGRLRVIWIATHDSIALGEDGPTHQPIETLAHFRAMPNLHVWRPADGNETSAAYAVALTVSGTPSILALTRQGMPQLRASSSERASKGGYNVLERENATITLVSTGSEVSVCMEAADILLEKHSVHARIVSMPCMEVFDAQPMAYRLSVLVPGMPIMSVEAGSTQGWDRYSHVQFGINRFGESAPCKDVFELFQMTPLGVVERALKTIHFYNGRDLGSPLERPFEQVM